MKLLYAVGSAVLAAVAACTIFLASIAGHCTFGMDLTTLQLLFLLFGWVLLLAVMAVGGALGYAFGWRPMIAALAVIALSGGVVAIREAVPHIIIPDGGPGCRIDL